MSTVYWACGKCGGEVGSAQQITWLADGPYHPECARAKEFAQLQKQEHKEHLVRRLADGWYAIHFCKQCQQEAKHENVHNIPQQ